MSHRGLQSPGEREELWNNLESQVTRALFAHWINQPGASVSSARVCAQPFTNGEQETKTSSINIMTGISLFLGQAWPSKTLKYMINLKSKRLKHMLKCSAAPDLTTEVSTEKSMLPTCSSGAQMYGLRVP